MKIRLGYACVPVTIDETSSHTITYTNYKRLGKKANEKLDSVIKSNFESLKKILKYNIRNDIIFFRMTSELIPLVSHPDVHYDFINQYKEYYKKIGYLVSTNPVDLLKIIENKIVVLTGQSGAGKSSLLNRINPDFKLHTQQTSKALGRGKHTTRHCQLFPIGSGWVADTPGFSSLDFSRIDLLELKDKNS